jgi:hypothetical protein
MLLSPSLLSESYPKILEAVPWKKISVFTAGFHLSHLFISFSLAEDWTTSGTVDGTG